LEGEQMGLNDLLIWMSARVAGSWQQFRGAVEEFHAALHGSELSQNDGDQPESLPIYQAARLTFQRQAHVEFFSQNEWRVAPPTLAIAPKPDHVMGVVCGARSPAILQTLSNAPPGVTVDVHTSSASPDCIRLRAADRSALRSLANSLGMWIQEDAPTALLASVPLVDDARSRTQAQSPSGPGWMIERFSTSNLRWERHEQQTIEHVQTGMFRMRMGFQRFHFLRWRGHTYRCAVQVGKYAVLRHARRSCLLTYDAQRALLSILPTCRPPLFVERALLLCSGLLPEFNPSSGCLEYSEVPKTIAQEAARLLRQELVVI
jgi:hypothetical protein